VDNKEEWDLKMAVYAAMIDRMDQNIGRLLNKIRELGKEDNTLVFFLSDNGGCEGEANYTPDIPPGPVESYRSVDAPWANASNTPFRKYKNWNHEGGICTPLIAYWPDVIQNGGKIAHQVGHIIDIMATFVDISGARYPTEFKGHEVWPMEGKSLLPILEGKNRTEPDKLFWQIAPERHRAVRSGKWKLLSVSPQDPWELYDLERDRFEMYNLAEKYPDKVDLLAKSYADWEQKKTVLPE